MREPLVFLDFDGVLNSTRSAIAMQTYNRFDPIAVMLVERLCVEGEARIVVSSTWRIGHETTQSLRDRMRDCGALRLSRYVIGMTGRSKTRGHEIAEWREAHKHAGPYVILDDDSDMLEGQPLVKTDHEYGMSRAEFDTAANILYGGRKSPEAHLHSQAMLDWRERWV